VVLLLDEPSSLPRMVSGGSEDGGAGPNGWTKEVQRRRGEVNVVGSDDDSLEHARGRSAKHDNSEDNDDEYSRTERVFVRTREPCSQRDAYCTA
jgi:hypothetical protein